MKSTGKNVLKFPRVLRIEPASLCNLACVHCPTGTVRMKRGIMRPETFARILGAVRRNKGLIKVIVLYHGGEPLLNRFFFDFVRQLKSINRDFFIKTVSNGAALTPEISKKLIASGIDAIEFSLDGFSAQESQRWRKKSNSSKIIENIKVLIALAKKSRPHKPAIYIANTQFLDKTPRGGFLPKIRVPGWLKKEFNQSVEFKCTYAVHWPDMKLGPDFEAKTIPGLKAGNECDHIVSTVTVRYDGSVVPCCYDLTSRMVMGNVGDKSLEKIWNNKKYRDLRDSIKRNNFVSICASCAVVNPPRYLVPKKHPGGN